MAQVETKAKTRSRPAAKRASIERGVQQNGPALNGAKRSARWVQQLEPQPLRWTTEEFQRMGDSGVFEGRHVELIEGVIVGLMTMGPPHVVGVMKAARQAERAFGDGFVVRSQMPLNVSGTTDPEPDIAVVPGEIEDYVRQHPTTALLVVEVSDTTLAYDRGKKASLYARAGISDYWLSNLIEDCVEVHRQPKKQKDAPFGHIYEDVRIYRRGETIAPLAKPDAQVPVDELLPRSVSD